MIFLLELFYITTYGISKLSNYLFMYGELTCVTIEVDKKWIRYLMKEGIR